MIDVWVALLILSLIRFLLWPLRRGDLLFAFSAGATVWVLLAFRNLSFGPDLEVYSVSFDEAGRASWGELISGSIQYLSKDPVFYGFAKLVSVLGFGVRAWIMTLSGFYCYCLARFIYRYSSAPLLSWLMFIALGFLAFNMTALRQSVAAAVLLLVIPHLVGRHFWRFTVGVVIASLFHWSALVFMLAYPLARKRLGPAQLLGLFGAAILSLTGDKLFREILRSLSRFEATLSDYSESIVSLNWSGFIVFGVIVTTSVIISRSLQGDLDEANVVFFNCVFLGLAFFSLSVVVAEAFRVAYYFAIAAIVLLPELITRLQVFQRRVVYTVTACAHLVYLLYTSPFVGYSVSR